MEPLGPRPFELERYFTQHEFQVKYKLCQSDSETFAMSELLEMADDECLQLWKNLKLNYTQSQGDPLLRQEISHLYQHITADDVLLVVPEEGIFVAMRAMVNYCRLKFKESSPHVVTTFPSYQSLYENLKTLDCRLDHWRPHWDDVHGWQFDLSNLEAHLTPETRILVVNFPHNPTGAMLTPQQWAKLILLCRDRKMLLFSDEMYHGAHLDSPALTSACSLYDDAISLYGMSKTFGLPGLRVGWVCTRNKQLLEDMHTYKAYTTICASAPSEVLTLIALRNKDKLVSRNVAILRDNLDKLDEFFQQHRDLFDWKRPAGGPITLVPLTGKALKTYGGTAESFAKILIEKAQILMLPSEKFEFHHTYFRVGYGRKNLPEVLAVLSEFLKSS